MSTSTEPTHAPITEYLAEPLRVGEPDVVGSLAVFPVFGPEPRLDYKSFAQGRKQGVTAGELASGASVSDLIVRNPTQTPVLLFEGEEVIGAQQNRTFDVSVLVAAHSELKVPVSCVEAGRWDGSRHLQPFSAAPQAAYPQLRRMKALAVRESVSVGADARANQGEVWDEVAAKSRRMGASSPTAAMHDIYEDRRAQLAQTAAGIAIHDGQCGALVAISGRFTVLDYVGRTDVFASLHGPLVQGYALDALDLQTQDHVEPPALDSARGFALLTSDCVPDQQNPAVGLGNELRFAANGITGTALVNDGELVQLTAFPRQHHEAHAEPRDGSARIRRPSRRR